MHVKVDTSSLRYENFFSGQDGGYFVGYRHQRGLQRGQGLGTVLKSVWRWLSPVVKSAGASLGNEGLATTARILTNVAQGAPVQETARKETAEGAKNLLRKASKKYLDGSGKKRRLVGRTFIKRPRMDALGPY
ncbi:hypothetical protein M3Y99_00099400 [Aphelenchoides fujianensis]|nr:hypothetical protein M3Y99_01002700 [Aphelenchoides fujianensis]KAI6243430.1 hypothetical protein M3Y99_00099400 [Aphelenchoides fujianensis]